VDLPKLFFRAVTPYHYLGAQLPILGWDRRIEGLA
jgi:hypothetical protein